MSRWRNKWKLNERKLMKASEGLFAPSLQMTWKWRGTSFDLYLEDQMIWTSNVGSVYWDTVNANSFARVLLEYINTPVVDLKKNNIKKQKLRFYEQKIIDNFAKLLRIMHAADRRIGKNIQSVRLFTEPDLLIRNIIARRC